MEINTIVGLSAAACSTFSFLPQVVKVIKTKQTQDLSLGMYLVLTLGVILWLIYGLLMNDLPVIVANVVTLIFATTILVMKMKYK